MLTITYIVFLLVSFSSSSRNNKSVISSGSSKSRPSKDTLQFVAVVSRHGSRVPIFTYTNDPYPYYDRRFWPQGKGELTNYGKQQLYGLGVKLRKKYSGFLPMPFYPDDTLAYYNPSDRDFESLSCLLASLYPPVKNEVWNKNLLWQPIPSRVYNFDVCDLLHNGECPELQIQAFERAVFYSLEVHKNASCLLHYVSNNTGEHLINILQIFQMTDTLVMQEENGFKLPLWTKPVYPKEMQGYLVKILNILYAGSKKILRLTAGPELEHLAGILNSKVNGSLKENSKMYVELAHDCTLYALLKALGSTIGEENMVLTSAHLIFELHKLNSSNIVKVLFHKNYLDDNPDEINIKDCPSPCLLENFNQFVKRINGPRSWKDDCKKVDILKHIDV